MLKRNGLYEDQVEGAGRRRVEVALEAQQAMVNIQQKLSPATDKELETVYNQPQVKNNFVHGPQKVVQLLMSPDSSRVNEAATKLKEGADADTVSAELIGSAPVKVPLDPNRPGLPPALAAALKDTKVGGVSKPFALSGGMGGQTEYAVLKVLNELPAQNIKFPEAKAELTTMVAKSRIQGGGEFQSKLDEKKRYANITINIDSFKPLLEEFKNPSPMMGTPRMAPQKSPKK